MVFRSGLRMEEALEKIERELEDIPETESLCGVHPRQPARNRPVSSEERDK